MHNIDRSMRGPERFTLQVHPDDAGRLGLSAGDRARVESDAGAITVAIEVTTAMMPGVASLPHGWGHHRDGMRLSVAARHAGASMNDVTSERHLDKLSGNAAFNGVAVPFGTCVRELRFWALGSRLWAWRDREPSNILITAPVAQLDRAPAF